MKFHTAALSATLAASAFLPSCALAQAPACQYVEVARLPLRYTGLGLNITTDGSINGTPATMLVDTGAAQTYLTSSAVKRHNLVLRNSGREAQGFGGYASIYHARVDDFSIGPARLARSNVRVITDFGGTPSFEALVGAPFLLQADLEISLATKEMKFFRPQNCSGRFLGYWDEKAVVLPFHRRGGDSPFAHFTVTVNGQKLDAIIDSGASTSMISLRAARRTGLTLDAPGVTRAADIGGVGTGRVARWRATFKRFEIGDEIVHDAEVGVIDYDGPIDVFLGADFLRAHRVLFAMSQQKIYLSYVGGEPFGQRHKLEPWIQAEADAGNADAQMALATYYMEGKLVARDTALAAQWAAKAARGGNPEANIVLGRHMLLTGRHAEAATRLRAGLDKLPGQREAALWLYIARVRSSQAELAKTELAAARGRDDAWPAPVIDFYLGKLDEATLLEEARDDGKLAKPRTCQALSALTEWHAAHGQVEAAARLRAQGGEKCSAAPAAP